MEPSILNTRIFFSLLGGGVVVHAMWYSFGFSDNDIIKIGVADLDFGKGGDALMGNFDVNTFWL